MHQGSIALRFNDGIRNDQSSEPLINVASVERGSSTSQLAPAPLAGASFVVSGGNPNDRVGPLRRVFQLGQVIVARSQRDILASHRKQPQQVPAGAVPYWCSLFWHQNANYWRAVTRPRWGCSGSNNRAGDFDYLAISSADYVSPAVGRQAYGPWPPRWGP
jgi:hypothetical protein